jgi:hypothetical protein
MRVSIDGQILLWKNNDGDRHAPYRRHKEMADQVLA